MHGGGSRKVKAAAAARVAEAKAQRELGRLAAVQGPAEPVADPLTALARLAGEVLRWKDLLAEHVAELQALRYGGEGGEQIRGELVLFERALDRCSTVLATIAKLDIDERLARIEEAKAALVLRAIEAALDAAGVAGEARVEAKRVAARQLRSVA